MKKKSQSYLNEIVKNYEKSEEKKIFYHGTNEKFDNFDIEKAKDGWCGRGFYFIEDKLKAKKFGKIVLSVNLDIKNPYIPISDSPSSLYSEIKEKFINKEDHYKDIDIAKILQENNYDGIVYKHWDEDVGTYYVVFDVSKIKVVDKFETQNKLLRKSK